jgi:hypothetical protein
VKNKNVKKYVIKSNRFNENKNTSFNILLLLMYYPIFRLIFQGGDYIRKINMLYVQKLVQRFTAKQIV